MRIYTPSEISISMPPSAAKQLIKTMSKQEIKTMSTLTKSVLLARSNNVKISGIKDSEIIFSPKERM